MRRPSPQRVPARATRLALGLFEGEDYRWRAPGEDGPGARLGVLPVHVILTSIPDGARVPAGVPLDFRGTVWGGEGGVVEVELAVDGGAWAPARLGPSRGRCARRFWDATVTLAEGVHQLSVRARDVAGAVQPPAPNVRGYANNSAHRVRVSAGQGAARRSCG